MRLFSLAVMFVCLGLAATISAQTVAIEDWGASKPERSPTASWYGSTGLIIVPTARIAPPLKITGGFHTVDLDACDQDVYNANVALMSDVEFGVARINNVRSSELGTETYTDETIFNAKYRVDMGTLFGLAGTPELAIGVFDGADKMDRAIYVVASKPLSLDRNDQAARVSFHVGYGKTEHEVGALDGLFFGIDLVPFDSALLQVEYDAEDFNAALRYFATEWLSLDVGWLDGNFGWGASARTVF